MNKNQLYMPSTKVNNSSDNNITNGGFDFEKYVPYVDAVKNLLVPNLEKSIYEGLEVFVYSQKDSLLSQYGFRKCLDVATTLEDPFSGIYENPDLENVGIIKGIIKPAVKYFIKNGLINYFINAVVINNRLNKICRDLYIIRYGRDVPPYIDAWNLINENDYCFGYTNVSKSLSHTSVESITINNHVQNDSGSNYSVDELVKNHNNDDKKIGKNHSKILVDSSSSIYVISKAQDNTEPHNIKEGVSLKKKKIITDGSSEYLDVKLRKPNTKIDWKDKNVKVVNNETNNNCLEGDELLLPCNCENFLRKIIKTDSSSSSSHLIEQLKKLENAMQNTCFSFNDIFNQLDKKSTNKCQLFCKLREKYIEFKLNMKNHDGSMTNLFIDRIDINKKNSHLGKPSTSIEIDKSEKNDKETNSRFNFTFNKISNKNIDGGVTQEIIQNSNLNNNSNAHNFNDKFFTPPKIHENIFSSTKIKDSFEIEEKKISKECNSENSCNCSASTESSKIITESVANFYSNNFINNNNNNNINNNNNNNQIIKKKNKIIDNKDKVRSDENMKDFSSIRFKKNVEYYGNNNSVSTQIINNNDNNNKLIEKKISSMSHVDYDIFEKSQVFEILKTILEENEGQICSCNVEEEEEEKFITKTSVEQAIDRNEIRDDSSSSNHVVSPVGSNISLASKITRVISVDNIDAEVSDKYENNFDHFSDLDKSELNKRTSTAERKKEIESLLNREDFDIQEHEQNKIRSYSSRNLSEILAEGKKNNLSDSPKDKFEYYDDYLNVMKEIENNKGNLIPQGIKEVENLSKKNSQIQDSNKSEIISWHSGDNLSESMTINRRKNSSVSQRKNKYESYNEHFQVIDEIKEKNHKKDEEILSEKNVEFSNTDKNETKLVYNRENYGLKKKRLSEKDKSDHNCEYFYLLDEMEGHNNRTSTPERKRDIESLLKREDLNLQNVNRDKIEYYYDKNTTERLLEVEKKCSSILQQEKQHKTDDFIENGLNNNFKNSAVISKKISNPPSKVSQASKIPRSISQKEVNYKDTDFYHNNNNSLIDLTSICQCSSDSDSADDKNLMVPKDQASRNKKNEIKSNNLPRRHFNIRALISALYRGLKNIFSIAILRKLKHLLKQRILNLTKKREKINNNFCVPKSCENRVPNYNSINLNNKSEINNKINNKYSNRLSKNLKREKNTLNFHQHFKTSKHKTKIINKDKQGSEYTCCRNRNNLQEDWVNPKIINSHKAVNKFLSYCDCDYAARKRSYHRKYMKRRSSEYIILNNKKFKKSLSKESYPCCYYKNLAAKHLAEYLNFRLRHQVMSDTDDVHCKECLESTDSELKSMVNEYLKTSRSEKKKSMKKNFEK